MSELKGVLNVFSPSKKLLSNGLRSYKKRYYNPASGDYKGVNSSITTIEVNASGPGFYNLHDAYIELMGQVLKNAWSNSQHGIHKPWTIPHVQQGLTLDQ